jgi:hypothetical protein
MKFRLIVIGILLFSISVQAQVSELQKNPFHKAYRDSLKAMNYPYTFPIFGKKAYKKGFDVPYPWGGGVNYFWAKQEITISHLAVGFNDRPPVDLSNVVTFGKTTSTANAYTIRPDLFVFPFLSIYGILGFGSGLTEVPVVEPVSFNTKTNNKVTSAGFGFTAAGGFQGVIIILDNNFNWVNTEKLTELVPAYNFAGRLAHNFNSAMRADRSITIWVGGFFQKLRAETKGVIKVSELFPGATASQKQIITGQLNDWLTKLSPEQRSVGQDIVDRIKDHFAGTDPGNGTITYELDKKIAGPWNMIYGGQFQFNKNWMMRIEMGAFGKRSQFLLSGNYRFQSLKKKSTSPAATN